MWVPAVGILLICLQFSTISGIEPFERIIGGKNTTIEEHPYQISLFILVEDEKMFICGGSIISQEWVLTAAHCVEDAVILNVHAGSSYFSEEGITITAQRFYKHPRYQSVTADYDVAVVKLDRPLLFNTNRIKRVKLIQSGMELPPGLTTVVTGWGFTKNSVIYFNTIVDGGKVPHAYAFRAGMLATVLKEVRLPIVSRESCQKSYPNDVITKNMICAGVSSGQKDTCKGDSGGPMVAESSTVQVGIVSWGAPCGRGTSPGVYTNIAVPAIRNWITKQTNVQ